jgi:hypothetical protein
MVAAAVAESLDNPLTANAVANRVLENLTADERLDKNDLFSIITAFRTVNPTDTSALNFQIFPYRDGDPAKAGGQSILEVGAGWQDTVAKLQDFSNNTRPPSTVTPAGVTVRVANATTREGIADAAASELARLGFRATAATGTKRAVAQTEVRYRPDSLQKGLALLDSLDPAARLVADPALKDVDVEIVLGTDFKSILAPEGTAPGATPTTAPPATAATTPTTVTPTTTPPTTASPQALQERLFGAPAPNGPPCL